MNTNTVTKYTIFARYIIAIILGSILTACATISKQDCLQGNWPQAGYKDAIAGHTSSRFASHVKACAKHGIDASESIYLAGYEEGLQKYCLPRNGIEQGARHHEYRGICPVELQTEFLEQYILGLQIARRNITREYWNYDHKLDNARFRHARQNNNQNSNQHNDQRRVKQNRRINVLKNKLDSLRTERSNINRKIDRWRAELSNSGVVR